MDLQEQRDQSDERLSHIERDYHTGRTVIVTTLVVLLLAQAYIFFIVQGPDRPAAALMEFQSAHVLGASDLCAGDTLAYEIGLRVSAPGVFGLDVATWRLDPPSFAIYETQQRHIVFTGPTEYTLSRQWTVPATITDPTTNEKAPWTPGAYERRHAISSLSRNTTPSIIAIPFTIREDCP